MSISPDAVLHKLDSNANQITQLIYQKSSLWSQYVVFTWRWWLAIALTILPWLVWYGVTKKNQSMHRILLSGFFVLITSVMLDTVGDQFGLWHYRFNVIPIAPSYFPWDFSLQPVMVMFTIQTFPKINAVVKAIIFALGSSFVGEPIFQTLDMYYTIHWNLVYSVPIQFVIYLIAYKMCKELYKFDPL